MSKQKDAKKKQKPRKLTRKQKAVLDILLAEPKTQQNEAYRRVMDTNSKQNATIEASRLVNRPEAQIYMQKHVDRAKNTIAGLMDSEREDIALKASKDVLDRHYGKATIRQESTTGKFTVNIDLTRGQAPQPDKDTITIEPEEAYQPTDQTESQPQPRATTH